MKFRIVLVTLGLLLIASVLATAAEPPALKVPTVKVPQLKVPQLICENGVCIQEAAPAASACTTGRRVKWFPRLRHLCHRLRFHRSIVLFPNAWWRR